MFPLKQVAILREGFELTMRLKALAVILVAAARTRLGSDEPSSRCLFRPACGVARKSRARGFAPGPKGDVQWLRSPRRVRLGTRGGLGDEFERLAFVERERL